MRKIRWGVLSTAGIAQKELIPAITRARNAEVAAIATGSDVGKAEGIASRFEISSVYDSYDKLLEDPEIDAVYIPLPNHLHKEWTIKAAHKGKHVLCEKPIGINAEEAEEMKKVCEENGVLLMEAFMYYFHPQHERAKEVIASGEIGDPVYMQAAFSFFMDEDKRKENIRVQKEKGGGSIYDVGCYGIHSIRQILGEEPESVHVHAKIDTDYEVETTSIGYLDFASGKKAVFESSFDMAGRDEYEIVGTKGKIQVPRAYRPDARGGEGIIRIESGNSIREEAIMGDQYRFQVEHFSEAILNDDKHVAHTMENTIANMRVIEACYKSIEQNRQVNINP
ncbi:Gfo/Idh/MocA family protein [Thalassobacillus pellis]|uniref:Gfo/Idh/MocA family protein n=1 Tax=Thalassobacillus pellis TaxID=748008 RepID=UPI0019604819|nr:Gfo/Idh/MocA family oxidoreductase [Thalassobacillus pellis]MBM7551583.1 putative dehydrogenase [Thalassobacillus pellis]